jgi:hypothetical protein
MNRVIFRSTISLKYGDNGEDELREPVEMLPVMVERAISPPSLPIILVDEDESSEPTEILPTMVETEIFPPLLLVLEVSISSTTIFPCPKDEPSSTWLIKATLPPALRISTPARAILPLVAPAKVTPSPPGALLPGAPPNWSQSTPLRISK